MKITLLLVISLMIPGSLKAQDDSSNLKSELNQEIDSLYPRKILNILLGS